MGKRGRDTDTPSSSRSTDSQDLPSQRSAAGEVTAQLAGVAISLFAADRASRLLTCLDDVPGPLGVPRWLWGLGALIVIAVPTSVWQARKLAVALLSLRR